MSKLQKLENNKITLERIRDILLDNKITDERVDRVCDQIDKLLGQILEELKNGT